MLPIPTPAAACHSVGPGKSRRLAPWAQASARRARIPQSNGDTDRPARGMNCRSNEMKQRPTPRAIANIAAATIRSLIRNWFACAGLRSRSSISVHNLPRGKKADGDQKQREKQEKAQASEHKRKRLTRHGTSFVEGDPNHKRVHRRHERGARPHDALQRRRRPEGSPNRQQDGDCAEHSAAKTSHPIRDAHESIAQWAGRKAHQAIGDRQRDERALWPSRCSATSGRFAIPCDFGSNFDHRAAFLRP